MPDGIDLRCSAAVFRGHAVLLVHRIRDGVAAWVLPGGTPREGESMTACVKRETREETGLSVEPTRVAFVLEVFGPGSRRRTMDLVFLATVPMLSGEPEPQEPDLEPRFVELDLLHDLDLRPPLAGHLRALYAKGAARTAAYLGNMWRPNGNSGSVPELAAFELPDEQAGELP